MATIRFNVKPSTARLMQIKAIFQDGEKQISRNIGKSIPTDKTPKGQWKYWDQGKEEVKNYGEDTDKINMVISKWKIRYKQYSDDCTRNETPFDLPVAIAITTGRRMNTLRAPAVLDVAAEFIKDMKTEHDLGTAKGYGTIVQQLEQYQTQQGRTIRVSDIDKSFHRKYILWLIEEHENINTTIVKKVGQVVRILKYAKEELKINEVNPDYNLVPDLKTIQPSKFPVNDAELAIIRNRKIENKYRRMVVDAFILATETGLRHSDVKQLQAVHIKSHVLADGNILRYIQLNAEKTTKDNTIPLSIRASEIIDKYMAYAEQDVNPAMRLKHRPSAKKIDDNLIFPFQYSQSSSEILKAEFREAKLFRECEVVYIQGNTTVKETFPLCDVISFHTARNTYITRLLQSNVAPAYVKDNAGHSNIKVTMNYFRDEELKRFQETINALNKM